jgi:hypothetical protein
MVWLLFTTITTMHAFTIMPTPPTPIVGNPVPILTTVASTATVIPSVQYHHHHHHLPLNDGIRSFLMDGTNVVNVASSSTSSGTTSTTMMVSLQERKIPTKEEIDQKKFTFNVIFWGGGFVAPFIATIFYFGFRFWEK